MPGAGDKSEQGTCSPCLHGAFGLDARPKLLTVKGYHKRNQGYLVKVKGRQGSEGDVGVCVGNRGQK